jgi:hypothetical protein
VLRAGIQIWAHGSVLCGHIGKYIYRFKNAWYKKENKRILHHKSI